MPTKAQNAAAFAFAHAHGLPGSVVVVERALSGPQYSAELMVLDGKTRVLAIGRKIKSEAPYCVDLAIVYPGVTDEAVIEAIERCDMTHRSNRGSALVNTLLQGVNKKVYDLPGRRVLFAPDLTGFAVISPSRIRIILIGDPKS